MATFKLEALHGKYVDDVNCQKLAETIWAVTRFVYLSNDEDHFTCYIAGPGVRDKADLLSYHLVKSYQVHEASSPADVAQSICDVGHEEQETDTTKQIATEPGFTQLIKQIALVVVQEDVSSTGRDETGVMLHHSVLFHVAHHQGRIKNATLLYKDLEHQESLVRIASTITRVCELIVEDWNRPLCKMKFLSTADWAQITKTAVNSIELDDHTLCDILVHNSQHRPDKLVADAWDGELNYAQLHHYSRHMATLLLQKGVAYEDRVAICMKKSKWALVAFCAIVQAGCTGVSLDFRNPQERTQNLLRKVDARIVLTDEWTEPSLHGVDAQILRCNFESWRETDATMATLEWPQISPSTAAFITFTGGSTGTPKAVVAEHGPLYAAASSIAEAVCLEQNSRYFQFTSFVTDGSLGNIFSTMLRGGCVCFPSEEERLDDVTEALRKSRATHAGLTNTVISQIEPSKVPDLRYLVAVGEGLSKENFSRWDSHVHVMVAYGITETIILDSFATAKQYRSDHRNIGKPSRGGLWIVSPDCPDQLKPIGAVGEILIEGPILAREYFGEPEKTAEKFITAPPWLQELKGGVGTLRCYRSGDYGIRNADGTVLYLGRVDMQVKIRGWRVELGEIEHSLSAGELHLHEIAVEAATLQERGHQQVLAAFVKVALPSEDDTVLLPMDDESRNIFRAAQSKLLELFPRYMVPSLFIPVHRLPRTTVGKRDRNRLRTLISTLTEEQLSAYQLRDSSMAQPAETADQELVQQSWAEVLGVTQTSIGLDDNFFEVGGDSLKAIQLVAELRDHERALTVSQIFERPIMSDMAADLDHPSDLSLEKPPQAFELLPGSQPKDRSIKEAAQACEISSDAIEDIYPATPMQEGLMAISARHSHLYSHCVVFELPKSLDVERFKQAWELLVAEQPVLRTRIVVLHGIGTMQVVTRSVSVDWHSTMSLNKFLHYKDNNPFTYGSELTRFGIVRADDNALCFAWSGHHAISDGWSRPKIFEEVRNIYDSGTATTQCPYTQFVRYIGEQDTNESDEFWKEQFEDSVEMFPRLPSADYTPRALQLQTFEMDFSRAAKSSITSATLIQAAWAVIVAAYANTDEAVFAQTLSGRDAPVTGIDKIMGITIATVPMRVVIDKTSTISQYLEDVQIYMNKVKQHQHVGIQRISRLSPEARSATAARNLLVIQPVHDGEESGLAQMGLQLVQKENKDTLDFALTVQCYIDAGQNSLHVAAHFDEKVIDDKQISCLLHLLEHVIEQLATESSTQTLHDVNMVSPYDLQCYASWNECLPSAVEKTLHGLIEERARTTPNDIALDGFDGQLTYAELDFLATQLAGHLKQKTGLSTESRVVLSFVKSKLPILTMLAVLKSGCVCVSTNPDHPSIRLLELAKDAEADIILCDEANVHRFDGQVSHVVAITETLLDKLKSGPISQEQPVVLPSHPSFIVYTSGSTGKPKGSVLEHRSLVTDFIALGQRIGLNAQSRTLQFSSYTFDAHILEIFGTLIHGGCVCVISDSERMDDLTQVMNEREVNFALLTKTVSRLLEPEEVPTLKTLILSGEANGRQDYLRWAPSVRLFNGMGPSECTPLVALTKEPVTPNDDPANIGHAMGCHLWIIDRYRPDKLVAIGCVGELTVEGPIVGRGYVNRPKQNAAAFVSGLTWANTGLGIQSPQTTSPSNTRRFYRSGDLAKMNADGSITFVGRADSQVKISGQRVELGEIEDYLRRYSRSFKTYAVEALSISSRRGATALAAFCARKIHNSHQDVRLNGNSATHNDLILPLDHETESELQFVQAEMLKVLPLYMVPAIFFPVKSLPFNASGKLERKTLRDWAASLDAETLGTYYLTDNKSTDVPQTEGEKQLQALWADILDIPVHTIGSGSNFFRLGGDSVLSMRLIAAARAVGVAMTVADVFAKPILKDMALAIVDVSEGQPCTKAAEIEPFSLYHGKLPLDQCMSETAQDCGVTPDMIEDIYPCTPLQEALMGASSHKPNAYTYEIRLKLPTSMDLANFKSSWEELVARHAIYRTRIVYRRDIGSMQVVLRSKITWHDIMDISAEQYLAQDGPLLVEYGSELSKFAVIQHGGERVFVGRLHHALYDGWSMMRTWEEFSRILRNEEEKDVIPFNRFMQHLTSIGEDQADQFWKSQFSVTVQSYPRLPSNCVPKPVQNRGKTFPFKRPSGGESTAATIIQAAWGILMSMYTASEDIVFGLTLSGRDAPIDGIADVIGPTLASVPISMHLNPEMKLGEVLRQIQITMADVRRHQHVGLQRIRRLSPEASAAADFQNLLIVHTMNDEDITSPLRALGLETIKSKAEETMDFALTVECTILPESLYVHMNYDNRFVADEQIPFMFAQLEHITNVLVGCQSMHLRDIDLVSSFDLEHLHSWNDEVPVYTKETLHKLFEAQVARSPDAIATIGFDTTYTYHELNTMADKLAVHLRQSGVDLEKHVVLSFKKSSWPIVAMLAVLKSGGVCVSVNYEHPLSRRLEIVQDIEPVLILCDAEQAEQYAAHTPKVIVIDAALFATRLTTTNSACDEPDVRPENAAFIVYTSGSSSGKPKGCILEHHAVCLSQKINASTMNITQDTRTLQFATYTWDPSILEIFGPLINGGSVCVISDDERMNDLTGVINARLATWTFQTPTVANLIDPQKIPTLETIIFCGEPLTQKVLRPWSTDNDMKLINFYSAAETSNIGTLNMKPHKSSGLISIGRANGCGVWITTLGNSDRLVPVGCTGEVVIEGHAVIRGYWRRPDENAAAFFEDPKWSQKNGQPRQKGRFYRTGDIGYFNHDGSVQLLGRADRQVKLNGMRVELYEIEHQIYQQLPSGSEITVEIVKRRTESLTAFIKLAEFHPQNQDDLSVEHEEQLKEFQALVDELHQTLPKKLPRYMVPSAYVPISQTPLLATTKTDRRSLRQYAEALSNSAFFHGGADVVKTSPRDAIEVSLQSVWSQLMKKPKNEIGINDDFLSLGGDSIIAMQVVSECRRLGIKVLVSTILLEKSIMAIAPHCTIDKSTQLTASIRAVKEPQFTIESFPDLRNTVNEELNASLAQENADLGLDWDDSLIAAVYPCTAMQEGILLSQQINPKLYQFRYVWEFVDNSSLKENLISRLAQAWETMVFRHSSLRTIIYEEASEYGQFIQVVLNAHPTSRFSQAEELINDSTELLSIQDSIEEGLYSYLPRLTVFTATNGTQSCLFSINHAFVDGTSVDLFQTELVGLLTGRAPVLPAMNFTRYVEFEYAKNPDLAIKYWTQYLQGVVPSNIPSTISQAEDEMPQRLANIELPAHATEGIASFCRSLGITQSAFIQTAWAKTLGGLIRQSDVCFGYIASERDAPLDGIEGCIGPLISLQTCRVHLTGSLNEALHSVHKDVIAGLEHRNCSVTLVKKALGLRGISLFNTCVAIRRGLTQAERTGLENLIKPKYGPENTEFAITVTAYVRSTSTQINISYDLDSITQERADSISDSLKSAIQDLILSGSSSPHSTKIDKPQVEKPGDGKQTAQSVTEKGLLDENDQKEQDNRLETDLQTVWAKVLNLDVSRVGCSDSFMSLGGDSIAAMQVTAQCRKLGIRLPVSAILKKKTISAITPYCKRTKNGTNKPQPTKSMYGVSFKLSPIQKRYLDQESTDGWAQYNQNITCRIGADVSEKQLQDALDGIVDRHDMLRARFSRTADGTWRQHILAPGHKLYRFESHAVAEISNEIVPLMQKGLEALDILHGPVFSVDHFKARGQDSTLFLLAHHLTIDIVSWQIIVHELEEKIGHGNSLTIPDLTFQQWCSMQEKEAEGASLEQIMPLSIPPSLFEYWQVSENIVADLVTESCELSTFTTNLILTRSNQAFDTTSLEIILGTLLSTFHKAFPDREVPSVFIEGHGREPCTENAIEPSQVVGWFTSMYPIHVTVDANATVFDVIRSVKDIRRQVPQNGRPYFAYRHTNIEGDKHLSHHDPIEILLNYSGVSHQLDNGDSMIQRESRVTVDIPQAGPSSRRMAMIDVEVGVSNGAMKLTFNLNKKMAHMAQIWQWIHSNTTVLAQAANDLAKRPPTPTLSDFPLLDITHKQLDSLLAMELRSLGIKSIEDVEEIFPVTAFQHFCLEGHQAIPPRCWDCTYFELPNDADIPKLQESCVAVVQETPILRTIFFSHASGYLQVVLKSLKPQIDVFDCDEDAESCMERLFMGDLDHLPSLGEPLLRFMVMRTPAKTRLLLRISHAQDDGFSRRLMVNALAMAYDGKQVPRSNPFSEYVRYAKQHHNEGVTYWRSVLSGTQPTRILDVETAREKSSAIRVERTLPHFPTLGEVTSATIFNTACALMLRSITGSSDVIFGRITSGRTGLDSDFQHSLGPCVNIIPVRVQFPASYNGSDALQLVHKRFVESIPYETIGLDDIISECTDWRTSKVEFPIITQHINQEEGYEVQSAGGGAFDCHYWEPKSEDPYPRSLCLAAFPNRNGVKISICANSSYTKRDFLERIMDELCQSIRYVAEQSKV